LWPAYISELFLWQLVQMRIEDPMDKKIQLKLESTLKLLWYTNYNDGAFLKCNKNEHKLRFKTRCRDVIILFNQCTNNCANWNGLYYLTIGCIVFIMKPV